MLRRFNLSLTGVLIFLIAVLSFGQEVPEDQLFTVHQDNVKPSMVDQYEKAADSLTAAFKEHSMEIPSMFTSQTDEFTYYYITPIENYAALDDMNDSWGEFIEKIGQEKWGEIEAGFEGTYFSHKDFIIRRSGELSHQPEKPRLVTKDASFIHWDWYWVEEGKSSEATEVVKKFKTLFAANNIEDQFTVWLTDIGTDYGLIVITQIATDASDYYRMVKERQELVGDEMELLYDKFVKYVKKFEHENGRLRHDLSYQKASD